jgi:hypothetical protein
MSISETALKTAAAVGQSLDRAMQLQRREQERRENISSQYAIDKSDFGTVHPDLLPHIQKEYDNVLLARQSLIKNESGASARLRQAKQRYDNELTVMKARTKEYVDDRAAIQSGEALNTMEDLDNNWSGMVRELTGYTDEETNKRVEPVDFFQSSFVDVTKPLLTPIAKPLVDAGVLLEDLSKITTTSSAFIDDPKEGEIVSDEIIKSGVEKAIRLNLPKDEDGNYLMPDEKFLDGAIFNFFSATATEDEKNNFVEFRNKTLGNQAALQTAFGMFEKKLKEDAINVQRDAYRVKSKESAVRPVELPLITAFEAPEGVYEKGLYRPEGKGSPLTIPMDKLDVIIAPSEDKRVVVTPDGEVKYYSKEFEAETGDVYAGVETGTKTGSYAFAEVSEFPISEKLAGNIERAKKKARENWLMEQATTQ